MHIERQTRHQVHTIALQVDAMPSGGYRIQTPQARGWAVVAHTPHQLAAALSQAFLEAQVAAYARWRGERYDLDDLTEPMAGDPLAPARAHPRPPTNTRPVGWGRNQQRPDVAPLEQWVRLPDGMWQSPAGRRYRSDSMMVSRVRARRRAAGLSD